MIKNVIADAIKRLKLHCLVNHFNNVILFGGQK